MNTIFNSYLSDKYEILSVLGQGSFCKVYLVRHKILNCQRAIKLIPKEQSSSDTVLSEANLLKSLRHSAIPTLYEIEEDDSYYYLIEEYIEGETLEEFLLNQQHISQNVFFNLSLQLCDIFRYLHHFGSSPILYLDLKPEHLLLCGLQIKLIDFNASAYLSNLGNQYRLYGNESYSAPEISFGLAPHPKWDIYSIGKILAFMATFTTPSLSHKTQRIIQKAMHENPANRYETVDQLIHALATNQNTYHTYSCKKIAVLGSHSGCGSTHIAFSLVSVLNYMGYSACYFEKNNTNNLQQAKEQLFPVRECEGLIYYKYFMGYPNYGPGILLPDRQDAFQILDFGSDQTNLEELYEADLILLICSNHVWKWTSPLEKAENLLNLKNNIKYICNMGQAPSLFHYAHLFHAPIYEFPYDLHPFGVNRQKCKFVTKLLQLKKEESLFFRLKKGLYPPKSSPSAD